MTRRPPNRSGAVFNRRCVQLLQRAFVLCDDRQARIRRQLAKDVPVSAPDNVPDHAWRGRVQSVERALALLDAIAAGSPRGSTVAELALACGINRATAWRLLATLEGRGLVGGDPAILAVGRRSGLVYVDEVAPPAVLTVNWLARPVPLHATSTGKAWLAWLPEHEA